MSAQAEEPLASRDSLIRSIQNWEAGQNRPDALHRRTLSAVFRTATLAIFQPPPVAPLERVQPEEMIELIAQIQTSTLAPRSLDLIGLEVERLCTEYSTEPTDKLLPQVHHWLGQLHHIRTNHNLRLQEQARLLELTGWLSLLLSTLSHDTTDDATTERARRAALDLGQETGNLKIQAWAFEITGWMNLTRQEWEQVLPTARRGQEVAPDTDIAVQLASQEAEALANLGREDEARTALGRAQAIMESLPAPQNPGNHFVVDHDKLDKLALSCELHWHNHDRADVLAAALERKFTAPDGTLTKPMRVAEAWTSRAMIAARGGDLDEAIVVANHTLDIPRKSIPSLIQSTSKLDRPPGRGP